MARSLVVKIVGDASSYEKALVKASRGTKVFTRDMEKATRGVAAGSGLFAGFGRSIAFASGGFLAFSSATRFLTESVAAAREAGVAQRSLAAQMKASGESFAANRAQIEKAADSYARFGFNNDQVIESLTVLERGTGRIDTALRLQGLTADIARAKNIELGAAANVVAKVFGGQETALRRAIPGLQKSAHGWDLIREAQQKMAGQAAAGTTVSERFNATLHNTQVTIGQALLPILNKYLNQLSKWLDQMNRSGRLAKDVNQFADAIGNLAGAIGVLHQAVTKFSGGQNWLEKQLGKLGFLVSSLPKQVLQSAPAAYRNMIDAWKKLLGIQDATKTKGPAGLEGPINQAAQGVVNTASTALVKATRRTGVTAKERNQWFDALVDRSLGRVQYQPLQQQFGALRKVYDLISRRIKVTQDITRRLNLEDRLMSVVAQMKQTRDQVIAGYVDALQFNVDKAGATKGVADDLAALRRLQGYLIKVLRMHQGNLDTQRQLLQVQQQITSIQQQQAAERKRQAQLAAQRRIAREQAAQFRQLGLDPTGGALIPGVQALRKQLAALEARAAGTLIGRRNQALFARLQKVLSGRLGKVGKQVRESIQQILADIRQQLADATKAVSSDTGGTLGSTTIIPPRMAGQYALAGATPGYGYAPARAVVINGGVHLHGVQNVSQLENELQKRSGQRAQARRGPS